MVFKQSKWCHTFLFYHMFHFICIFNIVYNLWKIYIHTEIYLYLICMYILCGEHAVIIKISFHLILVILYQLDFYSQKGLCLGRIKKRYGSVYWNSYYEHHFLCKYILIKQQLTSQSPRMMNYSLSIFVFVMLCNRWNFMSCYISILLNFNFN